jgi:hypothetical protein
MVSIRLSGRDDCVGAAQFVEQLRLDPFALRRPLGLGLGGGGSGGSFPLLGPRPNLLFLPPAEFPVDPELVRLRESAAR